MKFLSSNGVSDLKTAFTLLVILLFASILLQHFSVMRVIPGKKVTWVQTMMMSPETASRKSSTKQNIPVRKAWKMKYGPVYIFGAAAGNSTDNMAWDVIKVYAEINTTHYTVLTKQKELLRREITCCLMFRSGRKTDIVQQPVLHTWVHTEEAKQRTYYITCPNRRHRYETIPSKVGLSLSDSTCNLNNVTFVRTIVPYKEPGEKLALGTQVAYGSVSPELIIEWMETYRYLGVDKVISYYHKNINKDALNVFQYYNALGFVDLYRYIPAGEAKQPRNFDNASYQLFNDLTLVVKDSFEKMSGYRYFGIIDLDEFLIPAKNRTLKEMLVRLGKHYKNAAGFAFRTQFYYTSWGKSGKGNDLILGQYVNRTATLPRFDRAKQICIPKYIKTIRTHQMEPVEGFKRVQVPSSEGYIRHFRHFRISKNKTETFYMNQVKRVTDTSLAEWSMRIKDRVYEVRRKVLGGKPKF